MLLQFHSPLTQRWPGFKKTRSDVLFIGTRAKTKSLGNRCLLSRLRCLICHWVFKLFKLWVPPLTFAILCDVTCVSISISIQQPCEPSWVKSCAVNPSKPQNTPHATAAVLFWSVFSWQYWELLSDIACRRMRPSLSLFHVAQLKMHRGSLCSGLWAL